MKATLFVVAIAGLMFAGCNKESAPGGPGATNRPGGTAANGTGNGTNANADGVTDSSRTFTLKVPSAAVNIDQGESDDVVLKIDRGSDFKQKVTLAITAPAELTVTPKTIEITPDQSDAKIRVQASSTAAPGIVDVQVRATPETGKDVSQSFQIEVKNNTSSGTSTTPRRTP